MGVITDYFAAASDELAASVLDGGPSKKAPHLPVVETKGLEPVVIMCSLEEILTGRDYDTVVENPRQGWALVMDEDGGGAVFAVTDELRDALAASDEDRLRAVATELAATEEIDASDAEEVEAIVTAVVELGALARGAKASGEGMYCWVCL